MCLLTQTANLCRSELWLSPKRGSNYLLNTEVRQQQGICAKLKVSLGKKKKAMYTCTQTPEVEQASKSFTYVNEYHKKYWQSLVKCLLCVKRSQSRHQTALRKSAAPEGKMCPSVHVAGPRTVLKPSPDCPESSEGWYTEGGVGS